LTRDFLLESAHLINSRVMLALHRGDSIPVRSFGRFVSLLPLFGILPRAIDLLMSAIFDSSNVRLSALAIRL
jgi:hypothetical protein